jgi:hypothetical protein
MRSFLGKLLRKLGIKSSVIIFLSKLGFGGFNTGDKILDLKLLINRSKKSIFNFMPTSRPLKLLISGVIPGMSEHSITSATIAFFLRLRGVEASALICDKAFSACELMHNTDFKSVQDFKNGEKISKCDICYNPSKKVFELLKIPLYSMSGYGISRHEVLVKYGDFSKLSLNEIFAIHINNIDFGEHVRTSVYRFLMAGVLSDTIETKTIALKYLENGLMYYESLQAFYKKNHPDIIMVTQGIYLLGGIACDFCKVKKIRFISWDYQYRRNGLVFSHGDTYHHELGKEPLESWETLQMTKERNKILDDYFFARREGKLDKDEISYTSGTLTDTEQIANFLSINTNKPLVVVFTNVAWDGKVAVKSNIFDGPVELVWETIEYLLKKDDIQLFIRIHPAEVRESIMAGSQKMEDLIKEKFPLLPPHIRIILPHENISSYGLAKLARVSVVYSTKMGLEAMLMGRQVIMTGDTLYRNKGFGLQPKTKEDYWKLLDDVENIKQIGEEELMRIRKYCYHWFFRRTIVVPSLYKNRPDSIVLNNLDDLLPGRDPEIDRLSNAIISGEPFHIGAV